MMKKFFKDNLPKPEDLKKYKARQLVSNLGLNESMKLYIDVMNKVADRSNDNLVKSKKLKKNSRQSSEQVKKMS